MLPGGGVGYPASILLSCPGGSLAGSNPLPPATPLATHPELESGRMATTLQHHAFLPTTTVGPWSHLPLSPGSPHGHDKAPSSLSSPFCSVLPLTVLEHATLTQLCPCCSLSLEHPVPTNPCLFFKVQHRLPPIPQKPSLATPPLHLSSTHVPLIKSFA